MIKKLTQAKQIENLQERVGQLEKGLPMEIDECIDRREFERRIKTLENRALSQGKLDEVQRTLEARRNVLAFIALALGIVALVIAAVWTARHKSNASTIHAGDSTRQEQKAGWGAHVVVPEIAPDAENGKPLTLYGGIDSNVRITTGTAAEHGLLLRLGGADSCWIQIKEQSEGVADPRDGKVWKEGFEHPPFVWSMVFGHPETVRLRVRTGCPGAMAYANSRGPITPVNESGTPHKSEVVTLQP